MVSGTCSADSTNLAGATGSSSYDLSCLHNFFIDGVNFLLGESVVICIPELTVLQAGGELQQLLAEL